MSGIPREEFAKELSKSFLSVWIDELSSFGTFPIESMKCNTPVIGKIPRLGTGMDGIYRSKWEFKFS